MIKKRTIKKCPLESVNITEDEAKQAVSAVKPQKLTLKQEKFIRFYIENGGNGIQAAIKAGYEENSAGEIAYENLNKPQIVQELNKLKDKLLLPIEERTGLTLEFKMNAIVKGIIACLNGGARGDGKMEVRGMASLLAEANKMQGHYAPEKHVNTNINSDIDLEELRELVNKYSKEF